MDGKIELLLEDYFPCKNMTKEERNYVITLLYNTKELEDNSDMIIVQCHLKKIGNNMYKANGLISSEISENRCFDAHINIEFNKISIKTDIVKLGSNDSNKEFTEYTVFTKNINEIYHRQTKFHI